MNHLKLLRTMQQDSSIFLLYEELFPDRSGYSVAICGKNGQFAFASDITNRRDAAERFFSLICKGDLAPCHLYDVLEDMLPLS